MRSRHPRVLPVLAALIAAERFASAGVVAMLFTYMTSSPFGFEVSAAAMVQNLWFPATYFAAVIGGWYADRLLGPQLAIANGTVTMAVAAVGLCVPFRPVFYGSLLFFVLGDGLQRVSIPSLLGANYANDDDRRDQGFFILYSASTLGFLLGTLVVGWLGLRVGPRWGFVSAAACMLVALAIVGLARERLGGIRLTPVNPSWQRSMRPTNMLGPAVFIALASVLWAVSHERGGLATILMLAGTALCLAGLFRSAGGSASEQGRTRMIVALSVVILVAWAVQAQSEILTQLVTDRNASDAIFGVQLQSRTFQLIETATSVVLAPIIGFMWLQLGRRGLAKSPLTKSAVGLFVVAVAAAMLARGVPRSTASLNPGWIAGAHVFSSWVDLFIMPIGFSVITRLAPTPFRATAVGIWLFSAASGSFLGDQTARLYEQWPLPNGAAVIFIQAFVAGAFVLGIATADGVAAPQRRRRLLLWAGAAPVLAAVMAGWMIANRTAAIEADSSPHTPSFRQDAALLPADQMLGFVALPAEDSIIGTDAANDALASSDEMPAHKVALPAYLLGRYEVTADQYQMCVHDGGCAAHAAEDYTDAATLPVRYVTQADALAYCAWLDAILPALDQPAPFRQAIAAIPNAHVTLPSEAEWEHAARGSEGQIYPWGTKLEPGFANYRGSGKAAPVPIGLYPRGVSRAGLYDAGGNVAEWTRSDYRGYPYVPTDGREAGADPQAAVVVRGGSYYDDVTLLRSTARQAVDRRRAYDFVGFRVVIRSGQTVPSPSPPRGATGK